VLPDPRHKLATPTQTEIAESGRQMAEVRAKYEGTDAWLKAPNGKPTNLNERQWVQVRTENFIRFFGDWENDPKNASKVVNENGEPKPLWHGTRHMGDFDYKFNYKYIGELGTSEGKGFYFTDNSKQAEGYGDGTMDSVLQVFLNMRNPIIGESHNITKQQLTNLFQEINKLDPEAMSNYGDVETRGINAIISEAVKLEMDGENSDIDMLHSINNGIGLDWKTYFNLVEKTLGYDGYIEDFLKSTGEKLSTVYVAWSNTQIKSATGNVGTFDPENADIRYKPLKQFPQQPLNRYAQERKEIMDALWEKYGVIFERNGAQGVIREALKTVDVPKEQKKVIEKIRTGQKQERETINKSHGVSQSEIDRIVKQMAEGHGFSEKEVMDVLGRQVIASLENDDKSTAAFLTAARVKNFPKRAADRVPEGTDGTIKWAYELMQEYAASRNLTMQQVMELAQATGFDAVAMGINLFAALKNRKDQILALDEELATTDSKEREIELQTQIALLYGELGLIDEAYDNQSTMAGRILFTRKMQKAEMLAELTQRSEKMEEMVYHTRNEMAMIETELDNLKQKARANDLLLDQLQQSLDAIETALGGTRLKEVAGEGRESIIKKMDAVNLDNDNIQARINTLLSQSAKLVELAQAQTQSVDAMRSRLARRRRKGEKPAPKDIILPKLRAYDYVIAAAYNSMLSGIPTVVINVSANALNMVMEQVFVNLYSQPLATPGAIWKTMTGFLPGVVNLGKTFIDKNPAYKQKWDMRKSEGIIYNYLFNFFTRVNMSFDSLFNTMNSRGSLWTLAWSKSKAEGGRHSASWWYENADWEMLQQADYEAKRATFNQNPEGLAGGFANLANKGYSALENVEGVAGVGTKALAFLLKTNVMPFTRIVASVGNAQVDYIPILGMLRGTQYKNTDPKLYLNKQMEKWRDPKTGNAIDNPFRSRNYARQMSRQLIGVTLLAMIYALLKMGDDDDEYPVITGTQSSNYFKNQQLRKSGVLANSIKIDGQYVPYNEWSIGGVLSAIANYDDAMKYGDAEGAFEKLTVAAFGITQAFMDRQFISGLTDLITNLDRKVKKDSKWLKRKTASTVALYTPASRLGQNIIQMYDDTDHKPETWMQELQNNSWLVNAITPQDVTRKIDQFGQVEKKRGLFERFIGIPAGKAINTPEDMKDIMKAMTKVKFALTMPAYVDMIVPDKTGKDGSIRLKGKDLEEFYILRAEEYMRYLRDNKESIIMQTGSGDVTQIKKDITNWGSRSTRTAKSVMLQKWEARQMKETYIIKSTTEETID
jgi:hypothetical protein